MSIELNTQEKEIFDAAKQGNGCDVSKLFQDIPVKEWEDTIKHLSQYSTENSKGPLPSLPVFGAIHPWKSARPGEPVSMIDQNSIEITVGIYPSPMLFNATGSLKTGKLEEAPMCRNFKW